MFRDLAVAHVDGSIGRLLLKLSRIDVLLLDDFAMAPLKDGERRDFLFGSIRLQDARSVRVALGVNPRHSSEQRV